MDDRTLDDYEKVKNTEIGNVDVANLADYIVEPSVFSNSILVNRETTDMQIGSLNRAFFYRSNNDLSFDAYVIQYNRDIYFVKSNICVELGREVIAKRFIPMISMQGYLQLWSLRLPDNLGRLSDWSKTGFEAAKIAETRWVRVIANMDIGAYDVFTALKDLPDPVWPELTKDRIFQLAAKDRTIDSLGHSIVRKLRGEIE